MSLPPALMARLAQRGLVQKSSEPTPAAENEEVIAEDYDEEEEEDDDNDDDDDAEEAHGPEVYEEKRNKREENFWLERMKLRMGEATETGGYKGCPNKYNIWHKCTLFCVNRWGDGIAEPSREYMRRYKRLRRKYPLPKGWTEMYDPGCGCYYFYCAADNVVSWLPPTHPKSQIGRTAAYLRRQLEENAGDGGSGGGGGGSGGGAGAGGSDGEHMDDDDDEDEDKETREARHQREIDDIINSSLRPRSSPPPQQTAKPQTPSMAPQDFPSLQESVAAAPSMPARKAKNRDLDRTLSRQRRDRRGGGGRYNRSDADPLDPMDPSAYSDTPRGKWSDGLHPGEERERSKKSSASGGGGGGGNSEGRDVRDRKRRASHSDVDEDNDDDDDERH